MFPVWGRCPSPLPPVLLALGGVFGLGEEKLPCEHLLLWEASAQLPGWPGKAGKAPGSLCVHAGAASWNAQGLPQAARPWSSTVGNTSVGCWGDIWGLPPPLLAAQAPSPFPQEDSSGSQKFLVSVSNVRIRGVRVKGGADAVHRDLSCPVCGALPGRTVWLSGEGGIASLLSQQVQSLARFLLCIPWEQGVNSLRLMPCSPFPFHVAGHLSWAQSSPHVKIQGVEEKNSE